MPSQHTVLAVMIPEKAAFFTKNQNNFKLVLNDTYEEALQTYQEAPENFRIILLDATFKDPVLVKEAIEKFHAISRFGVCIPFTTNNNEIESSRKAFCRDYCYVYPPITQIFHSILNREIYFFDSLEKCAGFTHYPTSSLKQKLLQLLHELWGIRAKHINFISPLELATFEAINQDFLKDSENTFNHEFAKAFQNPESESKPVSVLIAEDELGIRTHLADFLKHNQLNPIPVGSGSEAIQKAKENHEIELAVLDIGLPDFSGLEVLSELREIIPDSDTIMLTGYQSLGFVEQSSKKSAFAYLMKPMNRGELGATLAKALQTHCFRQLESWVRPDGFRNKTIFVRHSLLQEIISFRKKNHKVTTFEDVYAFFPHLQKNGESPDRVFEPAFLNHGFSDIMKPQNHKREYSK